MSVFDFFLTIDNHEKWWSLKKLDGALKCLFFTVVGIGTNYLGKLT